MSCVYGLVILYVCVPPCFTCYDYAYHFFRYPVLVFILQIKGTPRILCTCYCVIYVMYHTSLHLPFFLYLSPCLSSSPHKVSPHVSFFFSMHTTTPPLSPSSFSFLFFPTLYNVLYVIYTLYTFFNGLDLLTHTLTNAFDRFVDTRLDLLLLYYRICIFST